MKLQCAICGQHAGNFKQWWNQDTSWGICVRCVPEQLKRLGPDEMKKTWGVAGVHYEAPVEAV